MAQLTNAIPNIMIKASKICKAMGTLHWAVDPEAQNLQKGLVCFHGLIPMHSQGKVYPL